MSLELYAKVEHLLGIEDSTEFLHEGYLEILEQHEVKNLLDVGCGRGGLIKKLQEVGIDAKGIDLSHLMVEDAIKNGIDAQCMDICDVREKFDVITSVFDVLNFLDDESLDRFLDGVANALEEGGVFLADINTLHGFKNVAEGVMSVDRGNQFLNVEALYEDNQLVTTFTFFQQCEDGRYEREQSSITQYFHPINRFRKNQYLKLVEQRYINLYDEKDKMLLIFKKA